MLTLTINVYIGNKKLKAFLIRDHNFFSQHEKNYLSTIKCAN